MDSASTTRFHAPHAQRCVEQIERLKGRIEESLNVHSASSKKEVLRETEDEIYSSLSSLQAWILKSSKVMEILDPQTLEAVSKQLEELERSIQIATAATDAFIERSAWSLVFRLKRTNFDLPLSQALRDIANSIGNLHRLLENVTTRPAKQPKGKINASPDYDAFRKLFDQISPTDGRPLEYLALEILWKRFPQWERIAKRRSLLRRKQFPQEEGFPLWESIEAKVGNPYDPGDGLVYQIAQVAMVHELLQDFYNAWLQADPPTASPPQLRLLEMSKICLILRGMQKRNLLNNFLDSNTTDRDLPLSKGQLERIFKAQDVECSTTFACEQYRAIPRKWEEGDHLHLGEVEPLPLIWDSRRTYWHSPHRTESSAVDVGSGGLYDLQELIQVSDKMAAKKREHIMNEVKRIETLRHRHIVQFAKSYQRGKTYGILLKPAVTCDLSQLLEHFDRQRLGHFNDTRHILLTAFGCLSVGLSYLHQHGVRYRDIRPENILYKKGTGHNGYSGRLLWDALVHSDDMRETGDGKMRIATHYSARYAAPEIVVASANFRHESDTVTEEIKEKGTTVESGYSMKSHDKVESHTTSADVFSLGCIFSEILASLVSESLPLKQLEPPIFSNNLTEVTAWARKLQNHWPGLNPLWSLFTEMINPEPSVRPLLREVISTLHEAGETGETYFCSTCNQELLQSHAPEKRLSNSIDIPNQISEELVSLAEVQINDDLASLASMKSFADSGYESMEYLLYVQDAADELVLLLLNDERLSPLFNVAIQRANAPEKFVPRFRILLRTYSNELKEESSSQKSHEVTARLVQVRATYIANEIQRLCKSSNTQPVPQETLDERNKRVTAILQPSPQKVKQSVDPSDRYDQDENHSERDDSSFTFSMASSHSNALDDEHISFKDALRYDCKAFRNLETRLRRMVYPDTFEAINSVIINSYTLSSEKGAAVFNIHWDIQDYVESELGYDPSLLRRHHLLHDVLTVTGTASKAYAASAAEYVRWRWPNSKVDILGLVASALRQKNKPHLDGHVGPSEQDQSRTLGPNSLHVDTASFFVTFDPELFGVEARSEWIRVHVRGSLVELIETAQQLAWLSAVFRVPRYDQISYSEVVCEPKGDLNFTICPLGLEAIEVKDNACWLPLFNNGVVARGFPIPSRNKERGVEIPFNLMIRLSKIMYPMFHSKGLYLKGFSSLLYPTCISKDPVSVQWHLATGANSRTRLPPGSLPSTNGEYSWVESNDLEALSSAKRTFLGYCRLVDVHLGTEDSRDSFRATRYSQADDENPMPGLTPASVTTGTSGMGIWGAQATLDLVLPKYLHITTNQDSYLDMLDMARKTPIIIYDNHEESRRAWLVPTLGVVLHMAHIWARDKEDVGVDRLPYAALQWDSGTAAYTAIKENSKKEIRNSLVDEKSYRLSDLITRMLVSLDKMVDVEAHAKQEPGPMVKLENPKLYGWKLLAIAEGKPIISRKQLTVNQDWRLLATDILVLFCQNIGEIVKPAAEVKICDTANPMYRKQDQLIATMKCLQKLSEEHGRPMNSACLRLANRVYWLTPGEDLFKDCTHCLPPTHGKARPCMKQFQRLIVEDASTKAAEPSPIEGAITFGARKLIKPHSSENKTPKLSTGALRKLFGMKPTR